MFQLGYTMGMQAVARCAQSRSLMRKVGVWATYALAAVLDDSGATACSIYWVRSCRSASSCQPSTGYVGR